MLQELLVIFACVPPGSMGCQETRSTYVHYNPAVKERLDDMAGDVERKLPTYFVNKILPIATVVTKGEVMIPVTKNLLTGFDKSEMIKFAYNYNF